MELSPELQLQSVIKALQDTVIPALEPGNAMAREQAELCVAMVGFTLAHLPLAERYARLDLEHWLTLAEAITPPGALANDLEAACREARAVLDDPQAVRAEREQAAGALRRLISDAVEAAEPGTRQSDELARLVVQRSRAVIELERAWLAGLGIENDPNLPALDTLLKMRRD